MRYREFVSSMEFMGFHNLNFSKTQFFLPLESDSDYAIIRCNFNGHSVDLSVFSEKKLPSKICANTESLFLAIDKISETYSIPIVANLESDNLVPITAAINTRNLAQNLVRVKSSNIWAYGMNVRNSKDKTGDVVVQFKNKNGGAGEIYIYYDVPTVVYRRWQSAPSKGHYFWLYIRENYNYSKLTGNKHGILPNAINNW